MGEQPAKSFEVFKKVTSFLYREIGVLTESNHPEIYAKRNKHNSFYGPDRKRIARELYYQTKSERDPCVVLAQYEAITGLTLKDIKKAFSEGKWTASNGKIYYGGPKWAAIAEATLDLFYALVNKNNHIAQEKTRLLEQLEHNTGRLVDKFNQL